METCRKEVQKRAFFPQHLWESKVPVAIVRPPFLCSVCVRSLLTELLSLSKGYRRSNGSKALGFAAD